MNRKTVDVSAIVISLNSRRYLEGCLNSLRQSEWRKVTWETIVVDNGSTDGSLELLRDHYPDVRVLANDRNVGFCAAGNQGARAAAGRYLLFLNDDILIEGDAIAALVEWMDRHPEAGMIGSRLLNIDGTDQFSSGRTFPSPMNAIFGRKSVLTRLFPRAPWARRYLLSDKIDGTVPYKVDWVSAAAMMVRASIFEAIGGLAEDFYYFHEMLICKRCLDAGYFVWLHPQSKIRHYEGAGSGVRTRFVRRKHIEKFHVAAYRWYVLHHRIGRLNPLRCAIAAVLAVRAAALIAADAMKPGAPSAIEEAQSRPEGGVAL
jgi:GT2 family glycosyltransferase